MANFRHVRWGAAALMLGSGVLVAPARSASAQVRCQGLTAEQAASQGFSVIDYSNAPLKGSRGYYISGTQGNDFIIGSQGDDHMFAYGGNDIVCGKAGNDSLYGYSGNDILRGGAGNDYFSAGAGNDTLRGGSGNDSLHGGPNADLCIGGLGIDSLTNCEGSSTD